ncbi:hypothetical protein LAA29_180035 [Leuconostoc carnosum]|nr:hypothetical protein LCAC16_270035 [Leuconostoc carnosum]SPO33832.1 hypothetical protein LAA29_180035 [Leuconostoc carnosum]
MLTFPYKQLHSAYGYYILWLGTVHSINNTKNNSKITVIYRFLLKSA